MKTLSLLLAVAGTLGAFTANSGTFEGLESYGDLTLVDSIDCATDTTHDFHESPQGGSSVEELLGGKCRVMPHADGTASYFSYRLGKGKGLKPGDMYLLVVEYPDDLPRTATLLNRAMDSRNGFHTGRTVGDTLNAHIIPQTHCESWDVPLSGEYKRIEQLTVLNENVYPHDSTDGKKFLKSATDGFDVIFHLFQKSDAPDSAGVAIRAIRLYHVDDEESVAATIHYPAGDAPRRYVTFREEMADDSGRSFNTDKLDWTRNKVRLMKALGINCYSRDMLEFGYNQYWDITCGGKYSGWFNGTADYYSDEVDICGEAKIYLMPYYEYAGSRGPSGLGYSEYRKCVPLFDNINDSTHFNKFVQGSNGASGANVDLTDSAANEDFRKILESTIVRYKDKANFVGAWIRNRGSMPMSFSDNTLARFNADTKRTGDAAVTRQTIIEATGKTAEGDAYRELVNLCKVSDIYGEYRNWWYGKRADFLSDMQKYLADNGIANAKVFYSGCINEAGLIGRIGDWYNQYDDFVAANSGDAWKTLSGSSKSVKNIGWAAGDYEANFLKRDEWTWWPLEYNHAAPMADPATYQTRSNVALAYPYNCIYTAVAPNEAPKYRNATDDLFFSRHYCLYEGCGSDLNGYYTCEMDRADRASMLPELYAVAYQDPTTIGYLQGNQLARNFTGPVREFHENFLSLPAVKGKVLQGGGWSAMLTIRKYTVGDDQYYAVVNLSGEEIGAGWKYITDDNSVTKLYETVSGTEHEVGSGYMNWSMKPYQLLCFSTVKPGEVVVRPTAPTVPVDQIEVTNGYGQVSLVVPVSSPGMLGTNVSVAVEVTDDANKTVFAQTNVVTAAGTVAFVIPGLAPSTHYSWRVDAANEHGKSTSASGEFTTARYPVALDAAVATVAADGKSAVLSCGFAHLDEPSARVTLTLNGAEVKTWEGADAATGLSVEVMVRVGTTNVFAFAAVLPSGAQVMSEGAFVARVFNEWFRVDHQPTDRGTWTIPEALQASVGTSGGQAVLLLTGGEDLEELPRVAYAPETSSPTGLETVVSGRIKVAPCERAPDLSGEPEAKGGVCFLNGAKGAEPYGFANGAWHQLSGGSEIADGAWIDYEVKFDFANGEGPQMSYTVGDWTSERLAYGSQTKSISQFFFVNPKEIGCFMGVYYTLKGEGGVEITDADAPVFVVDGEAAFGLSPSEGGEAGSRTFSITIGNPVKGAYYTVFTTTSLAGDVPFTAERDSTPFSPESAEGTLVLTFDADAPAKFAKVVVSSEPFVQGAVLPSDK